MPRTTFNQRINKRMSHFGEMFGLLPLRLFLAWEFLDSGIEKLTTDNWFDQIRDNFPFPFNHLPVAFNWNLATTMELSGALLLLLGLGTRYASVALSILTLVAWYTVHAGYGYNVCANGYKMPLLYLICFFPLLTQGAGHLSLDHWLKTRGQQRNSSYGGL